MIWNQPLLGDLTGWLIKPNKIYSLSAKISLELVESHEVANNPHIFLTRANQHIQEINRQFDGNFNIFGPILFAEN